MNELIDDTDIAEQLSWLVRKLVFKLKTDPEGKDMLPEHNICPSCDMDHEALYGPCC